MCSFTEKDRLKFTCKRAHFDYPLGACLLVFVPDNQSNHWKFQIFSRFIYVGWLLIYEDRFHH